MTSLDVITTYSLLMITLFFSFSMGQRLRLGKLLPFSLFLYHSAFCAFYWHWSLDYGADSSMYYLKSFIIDYTFRPGTYFVISFVKIFTNNLHLSLFNTFLIFNFIGLFGLLLLANVLKSLWPYRRGYMKFIPYIILFLPGLSFWSSAIGKDTPAFFAICLAIFALMNITKRKHLFIIAIVLMFTIRPHIALLMVGAASVALASAKDVKIIHRFAFSIVATIAGFFAFNFTMQYIGLGSDVGISGIIEYILGRQDQNLGGGSSINIKDMGLPMKLFSYLFRPLFIDTSGVLGFVVSVENVILLSLVFLFIPMGIFTITSGNHAAVRFNIIFVIAGLLLLSLTTANMGISIRQKTMLLPSIFFLIAVIANVRYRKKAKYLNRYTHETE